MIKGKDY